MNINGIKVTPIHAYSYEEAMPILKKIEASIRADLPRAREDINRYKANNQGILFPVAHKELVACPVALFEAIYEDITK